MGLYSTPEGKKYKEKNFVSAVVYINNDRNRVLSFLDMLAEVFKNNFENSEIIFVNDCSTDKSVELIREKAKNDETIDLNEFAVTNEELYFKKIITNF